jgi:hypothetical protein
MKTMSDKQLYLLDVISNIQNYSTEQINLLNQKIENLENKILKPKKSNINNNNNLSQNENIINKQLKKCISSGDESSIINCISNINLKDIKELEINTIENTLLAICPILSKGNYIHECITFIKAILMSYNNQFKLREVTLKNINDILLYIKDNIENNSINSTYNKLINEYENKISILLSQMKTMSDKQLYLLDVISNLQNYSREQINYLNKKISDLENNILKQKESDNTNNINNNNISNNNLEKENTINEKLKNCISSGDELSIINCISNINLKEIKDLEINIIEDILLVLCPILSKGNYIHECISFIKAILMSYNNQIKLREVSLKNINDILLYIKNNINDVKDEDIIDISLLISYLKKK